MLTMAFHWTITACLMLVNLVSARVLHGHGSMNSSSASSMRELMRRAQGNPSDFTWIKRWAAIGDSFTAGIGSGNLYSQEKGDWQCSRYDHSYPALINHALGPAVQDFQFVACSGDRSAQIFDQVQNMKGNLDLVILTAGGNDLCLASMIKTCVFLPFQGEGKCQAVIDKAQENIDTILKPNLKQILVALSDKMNKDSVVVYNGYAQFFNTDNDGCTNDQDWAMPKLIGSPLSLTIDRRKKFNSLVVNINKAIQDVVDDVSKNSKPTYRISMSDWDPWPQQGVAGQFCDPSSTGRYPDASQPDLQFFKPDTYVNKGYHDELKRRQLSAAEEQKLVEEQTGNLYESLLWKSPSPPAEALHKLSPRAPAPPNCPGDGGFDFTLGLGLPDSFGKFFHPNMLGHETITSFALQTLVDTRAEVLGLDNPACEIVDDLKCWQKQGSKGYANPDQLNANYKKFCDQVKVPDHTVGWSSEVSYDEKTPDEHSFKLQLSNKASAFDKNECLKSFDKIINSCDGNDPNNPMDWKFGGQYVNGEYTYEVNIKRTNRPWPPIKKAYGSCEGWWKVIFSDYKLRGAGWSTWDFGEQTLKPSIKGCLGLGISKFNFDYFDAPDSDGMEWSLSARFPVFVRARCFKNNKVAMASGGFTDGCGGNDA